MRKNIFYAELVINNFFGDILKAEWVSSIELTPTREAEIQSSFRWDVEFHYPQKLERFDDLIVDFKLKTIEDTDSITETEYGEDKKIKHIAFMDGVSGLVDRSNTFANFLTVTFPSSVPYQTVAMLLQSNVVITTTKYLPARSL